MAQLLTIVFYLETISLERLPIFFQEFFVGLYLGAAFAKLLAIGFELLTVGLELLSFLLEGGAILLKLLFVLLDLGRGLDLLSGWRLGLGKYTWGCQQTRHENSRNKTDTLRSSHLKVGFHFHKILLLLSSERFNKNAKVDSFGFSSLRVEGPAACCSIC